MSARSDLAGLIAAEAPDTWMIYPYPATLRSFDDPAKPVAIVVEQRSVTAGHFSPTENSTPVQVGLVVWVVVDGGRGADPEPLEDLLEDARDQMNLIVEPLPDHVWNGESQRSQYNDQMPAYSFELTLAGTLTT